MSDLLISALSGIDQNVRKKIVGSYIDLKRNLAESRLDAAGLNAGKLCEAVIRHLQITAFGSNTPFGRKIPNFADECRKIICAPSGANITESEKAILPRALVFLYTMRNKRGIGHIGGDVDPNAIDGALIGRVSDWIVCELIRVNHNLSLEEAQDLVDGLAIRQLPDVWEVAGKKRVLRDGMSAKDQLLLLLYSCQDQTVLVEDLVSWVEYSNPAVLRSRIIGNLHKGRFVEWDRDSEFIVLSPKGAKYVEENLLGAEQVASRGV
ncbi:hypothetical protein [Algiphilus aromaticivorans]|uniref:hypothetical protein n=1 Tax=Algiphilus aromaticivorans TaxID=382454 RepID=UPI0005C1B5C4|nr:hypothetical protein [Algiphilus aromaticivorans]